MTTHLTKLLTLILFFNLLNSVQAQENSKSEKNKVSYKLPKTEVTNHQITVKGQKINYTATVGHMILLDEKGIEKANVFYTAYTKKDVNNTSERPITFCFNGGPGSSSVWLHMGAIGPKKVVMESNGLSISPPYKIEDNKYTWLDKTDLVFIDPVETGFSRPAENVDKKEFTGYNEDIKSVGDFIYKYVTENKRWNSPKLLTGESYGTTRSAGLSGYLQDRHGMYLNGIVLISAVLNFQTLYFTDGNDLLYALFLPSYAATAYHHNKIDKNKYPDFKSFLSKVEAFAVNEYNLFLMKGDQNTDESKTQMVTILSEYTGLSKAFIENNLFRISTQKFTKELLRNESQTVGRFDATVKGIDKSDAETSYDHDPSYNLSIYGAYTMAINHHLTENLNYQNSDMVYEILTGKVWPWNYGNAQNNFLNTAETLRASMHKNPFLKVHICSGYYDLATPYFATDYTVNHMFLNKEIKKNITTSYYHAGHMMYTIETEMEKFTLDIKSFYDGLLK